MPLCECGTVYVVPEGTPDTGRCANCEIGAVDDTTFSEDGLDDFEEYDFEEDDF
jgi:hypothetical protein